MIPYLTISASPFVNCRAGGFQKSQVDETAFGWRRSQKILGRRRSMPFCPDTAVHWRTVVAPAREESPHVDGGNEA